MWKYLKAAFWLQERVPLVGPLPVNVLALAAFGALGFGLPVFWWIGGALEAAFLFLLSTNSRFRKLVNARELPMREPIQATLAGLLSKLNEEDKRRQSELDQKISSIAELYEDSSTGYDLAPEQLHHLNHLSWLHLKLLLAKQQIQRSHAEAPMEELSNQITALEQELASMSPSPARESRAATLEIMHSRLLTARERSQRLQESQADIERIQQQVALVLEKATLHANPNSVSFTLKVSTQALDYSSFGETTTRQVDAVDTWFQSAISTR